MFIQRSCVYASPTEQAQLDAVVRRGTTSQKVARRARIVLMLSRQASPMAVARTLLGPDKRFRVLIVIRQVVVDRSPRAQAR